MNATTQDIQNLRNKTGVGMMDAKRALAAAGGDPEKAVAELRKAGIKLAAKRSARTVSQGMVEAYVHANGKVGALVVLGCETDFVARTEPFKELAHELAMQVAATNPKYLKPDEIPAEIITAETAIYRDQLKSEGKPEKVWDKIIAGKLEKFYAENCLLNQPYIRDDKLTVNDLIVQTIAKIGENVQLVSFARLSL